MAEAEPLRQSLAKIRVKVNYEAKLHAQTTHTTSRAEDTII